METLGRRLERDQFRREKNPAKSMVERSRKGAVKRGLEFIITEADIEPLPRLCPVLGTELEYNTKGIPCPPNAASLDRLDSTKGYIPGNVMVISFRANTLKSNATVEEVKKILKYMLFPNRDEYNNLCKVCGLDERYLNGRCRPCQLHRLKARPSKAKGILGTS